jgi:hypothetical protein
MFRPNADQFEKQYKVGPVLGKGGFGVVYAGVRCLDGHKVAIKHVAKLKIKEWGEVRDPSFIDISQVKLTCIKMSLLEPDSHCLKTDPDPEAKIIDKNMWPSSRSRSGER